MIRTRPIRCLLAAFSALAAAGLSSAGDSFLTQAQVAKRIGVTAAMVSSYETDIRLPSYEVMVRLADLFGVTVDYLLCRQDKRFLDISDLSEEEAALVCGMVELPTSRALSFCLK